MVGENIIKSKFDLHLYSDFSKIRVGGFEKQLIKNVKPNS